MRGVASGLENSEAVAMRDMRVKGSMVVGYLGKAVEDVQSFKD